MKSIAPLFIVISTLFFTGCAHVSVSAPVVVGKKYVIAAPGAYWSIDAGDLAIKATDPISVKVLEIRPPSWARVQLVDAGNAPFWINLQSAVTISEMPEKK